MVALLADLQQARQRNFGLDADIARMQAREAPAGPPPGTPARTRAPLATGREVREAIGNSLNIASEALALAGELYMHL